MYVLSNDAFSSTTWQALVEIFPGYLGKIAFRFLSIKDHVCIKIVWLDSFSKSLVVGKW
jgi:hypothetical protein